MAMPTDVNCQLTWCQPCIVPLGLHLRQRPAAKGKTWKKTQVHPDIIWHLNPTSILNPIWNAIWHTNAEWEWALAFACHKWVSEMTSLRNLEISGDIWRLSGVYSCLFSIASLCFIMLHGVLSIAELPAAEHCRPPNFFRWCHWSRKHEGWIQYRERQHRWDLAQRWPNRHAHGKQTPSEKPADATNIDRSLHNLSFK